MASVLDTAKARFKRSIDAHAESRQSQLDDQKFSAGNSDNNYQWDALAQASRQGGPVGRPMLTINQLPQHIRQVTNEERQNRPAVKVLPVDDKADPKVAEVFNGIIRHIEVRSDADVAIDSACDDQVTHGEGYFRVLAEYCDETSFDQDLLIKRIRNAFAVYDDPDIQDPTGLDRKWCFIVDELTKEEFEAQFPDADAVSWTLSGTGDYTSWFTTDGKLRVAEYYRIEKEKKTLCLWADGSTSFKGDEGAEKRYAAQGIPRAMGKDGKPVERVTTVSVIRWCKTNGFQILGEEKVVPGPFIPLFRVVGNEWYIDGKVIVSGIVRNAKDPQRMVNYWWSQEAEMLALAPKAPFVGGAGAFEGFEDKWQNANVVNYSYLEYNPISEDGTLIPPPQRVAPPMPPSGIIEAKLQSIDAVKQTTGQYNPALGAQSNETSGKAILARQHESDVGTYHYNDNLARAIRACGRYLVAVIPTYYDRKRIARIIGEDGTPDHAIIDPNAKQAYAEVQNEQGVIEEIYNPSVGKYDVVSSTGPSYTTKRMEAADGMLALVQANPQLMQVVGDLLVKNLDWPGADEIAARLKRAVPPNILGDDQNNDDPRLGQAMQMVEALTKELQGAHQQFTEYQQSMEVQKVNIDKFEATSKAQTDQFKALVEEYRAQTDRITAIKDMPMSEEEIQQIVIGTLHGLITSGDLSSAMSQQPGVQ